MPLSDIPTPPIPSAPDLQLQQEMGGSIGRGEKFILMGAELRTEATLYPQLGFEPTTTIEQVEILKAKMLESLQIQAVELYGLRPFLEQERRDARRDALLKLRRDLLSIPARDPKTGNRNHINLYTVLSMIEKDT